MKSLPLRLALGASFVSVLALADDPSVTGPTLGYTVDQTQSAVRPILGLPGSAVLGPAAALPFTASRAYLAPGGRHLLAQNKDSGQWQLIPDTTRLKTTQPIADLLPDPDLVAFSTDGASVALYSASRQQVQVVSGLPGSPAAARSINLSSLPGLLSALAVSADGQNVLMALSTDSGALLLHASADAAPRQIGTAARIASLAFVPGDADALWADAGRNEIVLLRDVAGAAETRVLAAEADGVSDPVAVAANAQSYFAVTSSGNVFSLPRSGGDLKQFTCSCSANGLNALGRDSLWRINDGSDGPLWVVDAAAARLFFVPAGGIE